MDSFKSLLIRISNQVSSKVIAVRKNRPKHNSSSAGASDHVEPECNITSPAVLSNWARNASDIAQVTLPVVQAAADSIPLAGAPLKTAIGGPLTVLQMIDTRIQNKSDLEGLTSRLYLLTDNISKAPAAHSDDEAQLREFLRARLEQTSRQLKDLAQAKRFAYKSVTNVLAGCSKDIDQCLLQYTVLSRMHDHDRQEELLSVTARSANTITEIRTLIIREVSKSQSALTSQMLDHVTLVDAAGRAHPIPMEYCVSFEQLQMMLAVIFKRDFPGARVQRRYGEAGLYDLCIDKATQVVQVTQHDWPDIDAQSKLLMRVIFQLAQSSYHEYKCQSCGASNKVDRRGVLQLSTWLTEGSMECQECGGRFQISLDRKGKRRRIPDAPQIDNTTRASIRNFRVDATSEPMTSDDKPYLFHVKARYDRVASFDDDLNFQTGDIIAVTDTPQDGWWYGQLVDESKREAGRHIFPANFVTSVSDQDKEFEAAMSRVRFGPLGSTDRILFYVRALYDYIAATDEDLNFEAGDIIGVSELNQDGWWNGELVDESKREPGRRAFPVNYVTLVSQDKRKEFDGGVSIARLVQELGFGESRSIPETWK